MIMISVSCSMRSFSKYGLQSYALSVCLLLTVRLINGRINLRLHSSAFTEMMKYSVKHVSYRRVRPYDYIYLGFISGV